MENVNTKKNANDFVGNFLLPTLILFMLFVFWEASVRIWDIPNYLLPAPTIILQEILGRFVYLIPHSWVTTYEILGGFLLGIIVGLGCAILIVSIPIFERTIYPILVFLQTVPKIAIAPLFIVWFGVGVFPKILVAFLIAFFPIVIDSVTGFKSVNKDMIYLVRSMGASKVEIFTKIQFPSALPNIFAGVKVASTLAVVGAIVGEFVGSDKGLGYVLIVANGLMDTTLLFAALTILTLIGLVMFYIVEYFEKVLIPWHVSKHNPD